MFPNDDICNLEAAKNAAQRLFRRYKNRNNQEQAVMGKSEVNRLMAATYQAINMPYSPNEEDVFSFMSVFDKNNDGKIQLKDIEEMAVRYLCGQDALKTNPQDKIKERVRQLSFSSPIISEDKRQFQKRQSYVNSNFETKNRKNLNIGYLSPTAKNYYPESISNLHSPKNRISFKESQTSTNGESIFSMGNKITSQKSKRQQIMKSAWNIYQTNINVAKKGITIQEAGKLMAESYRLISNRDFHPSKNDIQIWMKLCDKNKDGVVEWQDYQFFVHRTYEREVMNQSK